MKSHILLLFAIFLFIGCKEKSIPKQPADTIEITSAKETPNGPAGQKPAVLPKNETIRKPNYFKQILNYPIIQDSAAFISELKKDIGLFDDGDSNKKIKKYQKVKIYGSKKDFIIIEYENDFNNDKYQLALFTPEGKLVRILYGYRYGFIKIFPKERPFLMNLSLTNQGNGGHEFFKITNETLEDVIETFDNKHNNPNTFDHHQDTSVFEPNELKLTIADENNDGFNDLVFKGKIVLIEGRLAPGIWVQGETINGKRVEYSLEHPFKKAPVKFVFLYHPKTKHFKPKEDYQKKYREYYD